MHVSPALTSVIAFKYILHLLRRNAQSENVIYYWPYTVHGRLVVRRYAIMVSMPLQWFAPQNMYILETKVIKFKREFGFILHLFDINMCTTWNPKRRENESQIFCMKC